MSAGESEQIKRFVVPVVVDSSSAEQAELFLLDLLTEGVRWAEPLPTPYIGKACRTRVASHYATEEVHLLCDGMRAIAVPESHT